MTGDPLRDAFRTELQAVLAGLSITSPVWPLVDTINTKDAPDGNASFLTLRFGAGAEQPYTFGAPGANLWRETGDVFVDILPKLGIGHDVAEQYGRAIRDAFRNRRFDMTTGPQIRILAVGPSVGGPVDGAWWVETVGLSYRVLNVG
jgi:hypothetical protein